MNSKFVESQSVLSETENTDPTSIEGSTLMFINL
jgi:hypothetical protein